MKAGNRLVGLVGVALLLAGTALAGNLSKKSLKLYDAVSLDGKTLAPGTYELEWQGSGPKVEVSILKQGKMEESVPARLVARDRAEDNDGYITTATHNGGRSLSDVFFGGKKYQLKFAKSSMATSSASMHTKKQHVTRL